MREDEMKQKTRNETKKVVCEKGESRKKESKERDVKHVLWGSKARPWLGGWRVREEEKYGMTGGWWYRFVWVLRARAMTEKESNETRMRKDGRSVFGSGMRDEVKQNGKGKKREVWAKGPRP